MIITPSSQISPRILLAPMEGMVDPRLRAVLTSAAPYDWAVTEFVRVTNTLLPRRCFTRVAPELRNASCAANGTPVRVQLLGSDPSCMADNAARLTSLVPAGIDLNFGCPAPTVNRHRGGAILLNEPELLYRIAYEVSRAIDKRVPFTAKMRLGVHDKVRAIEAAQALVSGGAQMLVVHARTKAEGYQPPAHWEWVARISEHVDVPVIANGEIWTVDDYQRCIAISGVRDVMLGRGAVADPFLVERIRAQLNGKPIRAVNSDWPRVIPLVQNYRRRVCDEVEPRHAPGRIKQWLNLLRRNFVEGERLFAQLRALRTLEEIDRVLSSQMTIREAA